jgi:peptidylprolyl isomerase
MARAETGSRVKVAYKGNADDGTRFSGDLEFTIGEGTVIPGFEQAVMGMVPGESVTKKVPSDLAFGPYRDELQVELARKDLPPDLDLEVGQELEVPRREGGNNTKLVVTEVSDATVTFDANHPLAGKDIVFDISLVEVR